MRKQPLLIVLICFILGILFFEKFPFDEEWVFSFLAISFLSIVLCFFKKEYVQKFKFYVFGLFFFSLGIFCHFLNSHKFENLNLQKKENIVFKLVKKLNSNEKARRYEVVAWHSGSEFRTILSIPKSENELDYKHYYSAEVYIDKVEKPANDYQFNYQKHLARQGLFYQSYLPKQILVVERNDLNFSEKIKEKRLETLRKIDKSTISPKNGAFLKGIVLADRSEMDDGTVSDFNKTGLVHLLAISGSHMAIIFWLILFLLKPVFSAKNRSFKVLVSLAFIWIFAVFINYGNSVVRSCIMISSYYIYNLLQRKPDLLHAMALAGFLILIWDTNQIFNVGFLLSFVAVFGIFWLYEPILKLFPRKKNKVYKFFTALFSLTLSAQVSTLPLVLYYFHQFSGISLAANLIIIPFAQAIIVFSLLMVLAIGFGFNISWLNTAYDFFIQTILKIIHWFASFDAVFCKNVAMSFVEVAVLFISIYFLRFLILKFNLKNCINFSIWLLFFFALRIGLDFYQFEKSEILVHYFFEEKIFSVKEKDKVFIWIGEGSNQDKIDQHIILPYLISRRMKNYEMITRPKYAQSVVYEGRGYPL